MFSTESDEAAFDTKARRGRGHQKPKSVLISKLKPSEVWSIIKTIILNLLIKHENN